MKIKLGVKDLSSCFESYMMVIDATDEEKLRFDDFFNTEYPEDLKPFISEEKDEADLSFCSCLEVGKWLEERGYEVVYDHRYVIEAITEFFEKYVSEELSSENRTTVFEAKEKFCKELRWNPYFASLISTTQDHFLSL